MALIASLLVSLSARTEDFERGMGRAQRELRQTREAVAISQQAFVSFGRTIRNAALTAVSLATIRAGIQSIVTAGLGMEQLQRSFQAITGDAEASRREFAFVRTTANRLGFDLQTLAESYRGLLAATRSTTLAGQATRDVFEALSTASRAFGLSSEQTRRALIAVQQIIDKNVVSQEELKGQLAEALPGAVQIAARAFGRTTEELNDLVKSGVSATEFVTKFTAQLKRETPGALDTTTSQITRLKNELLDFKDRVAKDSGLLNFIKNLAGGGADALQRLRLLEEENTRLQNQQISQLGVDPTKAREADVAMLAEVNRRIKATEAELIRLQSPTTSAGILPQTRVHIHAAAEALKLLRQNQQLLISDLQQEAVERQRTGTIASQEAARVQAQLRQESEDQVNAAATLEAMRKRLADDEKTQSAAAEESARIALEDLRDLTEGQATYLQGLESQINAQILSADELARLALIEQRMLPAVREQAAIRLQTLQVLREINAARQVEEELDRRRQTQEDARKRAADLTARASEREGERSLQRAIANTQRFADFFSDTILSVTDIASQGFRAFADSVARDLLRLTQQTFLRPLLTQLATTGLGLLGGAIGSAQTLPAGFTAPAIPRSGFTPTLPLAEGGPILPGRFYTVGEQGPELLYSGSSAGRVFPNGAGGGGVVVNINGVRDMAGFRRSQGEVSQRIAAAVRAGMRAE